MSSFLAFLGISVLVIVAPGPDTAITIRNTLMGGRTGGILTAAGIAAGQTIWALATSAGIVALLLASEPIFLAVKYAGAVYLVYLGALALRTAIRPASAAAPSAGPSRRATRLGPASAFRQGIVSDLGNPKMTVFFASLLPQFVPAGAATFTGLLSLGLIFAAMTFVWLAFYAVAIARIGDLLRRPGVRRAVEGVTGAVLIGLGIRIAAERH
ncbi:lysine transporter LysE [Aliidongia dinghuensis]|uniref:Lysine transporter LysE n=1 Tax=Aliidongia dinghuensis TaxID=1867774 RepID=A0A8J2YPE9_9PROT|nr:LysE family translocator [Aliidongia dinghuensis]GGE99408.1 lysine transporter LysE [Aliidongia dinghuensis]